MNTAMNSVIASRQGTGNSFVVALQTTVRASGSTLTNTPSSYNASNGCSWEYTLARTKKVYIKNKPREELVKLTLVYAGSGVSPYKWEAIKKCVRQINGYSLTHTRKICSCGQTRCALITASWLHCGRLRVCFDHCGAEAIRSTDHGGPFNSGQF